MEPTDTMFDDALASAGAAIELSAHMSATANHLLYKADELASELGISEDDPRRRALREELELWGDEIAPAFAKATQKDPTGPRAASLQRPWRDPRLVAAGSS